MKTWIKSKTFWACIIIAVLIVYSHFDQGPGVASETDNILATVIKLLADFAVFALRDAIGGLGKSINNSNGGN